MITEVTRRRAAGRETARGYRGAATAGGSEETPAPPGHRSCTDKLQRYHCNYVDGSVPLTGRPAAGRRRTAGRRRRICVSPTRHSGRSRPRPARCRCSTRSRPVRRRRRGYGGRQSWQRGSPGSRAAAPEELPSQTPPPSPGTRSSTGWAAGRSRRWASCSRQGVLADDPLAGAVPERHADRRLVEHGREHLLELLGRRVRTRHVVCLTRRHERVYRSRRHTSCCDG